MKIATREAINDTSCVDALDDLLCSIKKVSRPEEVQMQPSIIHTSDRREIESAYQASMFCLPKMTTSRMLIDIFTAGIFTQYLYK
jgi:hypothetical protein